MVSRKVMNLECDTCGFTDSEPIHTSYEVANVRFRQRGWVITDTNDYCSLCAKGAQL